ncbi:hypothetical protein [Actinomadura hibisca]|uniref:hypothetical protein n=1 Tax=Actinomadura hibisca TaxID=68565 RepID=UPI00082A586A|nr:hypothetical protein [Actinomadura hibisca]
MSIIAPRREALVPATAFPALAARLGITASRRTLILVGALVAVVIGRAVFYRLADVVAAAPGPVYPLIADVRADLADAGHTITIERMGWDLSHDWRPYWQPEELLGGLAVVERTDGRLGTVLAVEVDVSCGMEEMALSYAQGYGARYVPAGGAR